MPSGLAEQSPIYKHKVSDTLCPSGDSLKFAAIETKTDFPDCFPARGNLELLDVDDPIVCHVAVRESKLAALTFPAD